MRTGSAMIVPSVISRVRAVAGRPLSRRCSATICGQLVVEQVAHREVHRHVEVEALVPPRPALRERHGQHVLGEGADQAGVLGDRHEDVRRDEAVVRVVPAGQRLDADDRAGLQVGLGLVLDEELLALDGPPQLGGEREPPRAVVVDGRVVPLDAGGAALGGVHRHVGPLQEGGRVGAVVGRDGHADAGADVEHDVAELERRGDRRLDGLGQLEHLGSGGAVGGEDRELVAAEPHRDAPRRRPRPRAGGRSPGGARRPGGGRGCR